ncbi:MAG: serine hydrolase domain-containing protein [Planctomycetaceae bacterium]
MSTCLDCRDWRRVGCAVLVLAALCWSSRPTHGDEPTADEPTVDEPTVDEPTVDELATDELAALLAQQLEGYLQERPKSGVIVGVSVHGERRYFAFGCFDDAAPDERPDEHTIYEIASITKTLTALTLATLVVDHQVALEDRLPTVLPEDLAVSADLQSVTLEQLATHRSGLPRLPVNMLVDAFTHADNPYAAYSVDRLRAMLPLTATVPLSRGQPAYSNFGMGLLGEALAMQQQTTFRELVQRQVLDPLQLSETFIDVPDEAAARFIAARTPAGELCPHWDFLALAGAGAIRSTAADMLSFLEANIQPPDSPLGEAIELTHQLRWRQEGQGMALAWHCDFPSEGDPVYWHNGGTGGFVSYAAFHRPSRTAVVLLSNSGDVATGRTPTDRIGRKIHQRLILGPSAP